MLGTTLENFTCALDIAICFGCHLHALVQSHVLETHLKVLEHSEKLQQLENIEHGNGEKPDEDLQSIVAIWHTTIVAEFSRFYSDHMTLGSY
jgi:alpha-D-ribose 1-methylphosphonate 5-triphosphate synthase subunit PhnH